MADNKCIKEISQTLRNYFNPVNKQWTQKEITLYLLLQNILEEYKLPYTLSQFKMDLNDIKNNIKNQTWYSESKYKQTLNWCMDQLLIKSYQHSKNKTDFKIVARFKESQINLEIYYQNEEFIYKLKNPILETSTNDKDKLCQIFGIKEGPHRIGVIEDIIRIIQEIGYFYVE